MREGPWAGRRMSGGGRKFGPHVRATVANGENQQRGSRFLAAPRGWQAPAPAESHRMVRAWGLVRSSGAKDTAEGARFVAKGCGGDITQKTKKFNRVRKFR